MSGLAAAGAVGRRAEGEPPGVCGRCSRCSLTASTRWSGGWGGGQTAGRVQELPLAPQLVGAKVEAGNSLLCCFTHNVL